MSWNLITLTTCPPGEFIYSQTLNSGKVEKRRFSDIFVLADQIAEIRKANSLPGASHDAALADIVAYTCLRLGYNPRWCYNTDKSVAQLLPKKRSGGCGGCGAHVR